MPNSAKMIIKGMMVLFLLLAPLVPAMAQDDLIDLVDLHLDTPTLARGYTISSTDNTFMVGVRPEVLAEETRVIIKHFSPAGLEFPDGLVPVSDIYEFDIFNKAAFQNKLPLMLKFILPSSSLSARQVYFYNGVLGEWIPLPTAYQDQNSVKGIIHLPYAKMVVLEDAKMSRGSASWYGYKNCLCAASPDYPKGTKLLVTNLDNNRSVEVVVNDFGPDRTIHPDRVIDLDKVAFKVLGELWQGIIPNVTVEPIKE